jgi:hypothetical protein
MARVTHEVNFDDGGSLGELAAKANAFYSDVAKGSAQQEKSFEELAKSIEEYNKSLGDSVKKGADAAESFDYLDKLNKRLRAGMDRLSGTTSNLSSRLGGIASRVKGVAQGFRDKSKAVAGNTKSMVASRVAALATRAALGVLGAATAAVGAAFQRSQKFVDTFNVVMAQGKAILDVFVDRIANVGTVIASLFTGDISLKEAGSQLLETFKGVGDELEREKRLAGELEEISQRIVREQINLNVQRSAANARLKELNFLVEDTTKSLNERRSAAEEAAKIEQDLLAREIALQEQKLAGLLGETQLTDEVRKRIEVLREEGIAWDKTTDAVDRYKTGLQDLGTTNSTIEDAEAAAQVAIELNNLITTSLEVQTTNNNKLNVINQEAQRAYLKRLEDRKKAEEDLANFRLSLIDRLNQIELNNLQGEERIRFEQKLAEEEIANLEKVAQEKFKAINAEFDLEEEFQQLREDLANQTEKRISEFRLSEAKTRISEQEQIELAEIELRKGTEDEKLAIQRKALEELRKVAAQEFGAGSLEALQIDVQLAQLDQTRIDATRQAALDELAVRQEIALARIDLQKETTEEELNLEQSKERAKNVALLRFAEERRQILLNQFGEDSPEVQLLDLEIEKIQEQINQLDSINLSPLDKIKQKLIDAFNLSAEDVQVISDQIGGIAENILSGFDALRQARLAQTEATIEQIESNIEELQSKLDIEEEREREGFANSAQELRDSLEEQNKARAKAEEERLNIERKAARQRLVQESAQQISSLSLAAARLLATEASKGIIGLVLAASGIATIFSIISRAKAQAVEFSSAPEFREGGSIVNGLLIGPSHEGGGIPGVYSDNQGRKRMVSLEGNEFVVNRTDAAKNMPLLEAINSGVDQDGLRRVLMDGISLEGINFNSGIQKLMGNGGREIILSNKPNNDADLMTALNAALGGKLDKLAAREEFFSHEGKIYKVDRSSSVPRFVPVN